MNRREFLKQTGMTAMGLAGLGSGCATIGFTEKAPVIYPPLRGHKVQPPENGCYIGFHGGQLDDYKRRIGVGPKIMVPQFLLQMIHRHFLKEKIEEISSQGAIPFVYRPLDFEIPMYGFKNLVSNQDFYVDLKKYAQEIVNFGKPLFFCPMLEMNIDRKYAMWSWASQPSLFKQVWRRMWHIFEDEGANQYATWVIEYHVDFEFRGYWPGDEYIDWIGFSAYNRKVHERYYGYRYLGDLIRQLYHYFRSNYPNKPIMVAEFGSTIGSDQPNWLRNAFKCIKSLPGLKAATFFNSPFIDKDFKDDHTLTDDSFEVYKEIMKDPYFIGVK